MKRLIAFMLALSVIFVLTGCGKSNEIKNVERLIDEIGEVSLESDSAISTAEKAYKQLSEKEQESVENYDALKLARATYNTLVEASWEKEKEEIQKTLIGQWGTYSSVTGDLMFITFMEDGLAYNLISNSSITGTDSFFIFYGGYEITRSYITFIHEVSYDDKGAITGSQKEDQINYTFENGELKLSKGVNEYGQGDWDAVLKESVNDRWWKVYTKFCDSHVSR